MANYILNNIINKHNLIIFVVYLFSDNKKEINYNNKIDCICQTLFGLMVLIPYICYMNKLTLLLLSILFSNLTYSQVIEVSYQEQLTFAYVESESLIKQWKNDDVIWDEYSYGYPPGEGRIVYIFDFNNMTVTTMDIINGEYKMRYEYELLLWLTVWKLINL